MVKIADHCQPNQLENGNYVPKYAWKENDYVQWGEHGILINRSEKKINHVNAFFEAFPQEPNDAFLRGEGNTLEEAEQQCFQEYEKILACPGHEYERRGQTDGYGYCKHCPMSKSDVFEPLTKCDVCHEPCNWTSIKQSDDTKLYYCREHDPKMCIADKTLERLVVRFIIKHHLIGRQDTYKEYTIKSFLLLDEQHHTPDMFPFESGWCEIWMKNEDLKVRYSPKECPPKNPITHAFDFLFGDE